MTSPSVGGQPHPPAPLTADQEVTLRRVAFGQSETRSLRAEDLGELYKRRLIEESRHGLQLTPAGRRLFEALPKPFIQSSRTFRSMLGDLTKSPRQR
jgi:DNA-binding transcriptional LysR family regulator